MAMYTPILDHVMMDLIQRTQIKMAPRHLPTAGQATHYSLNQISLLELILVGDLSLGEFDWLNTRPLENSA